MKKEELIKDQYYVEESMYNFIFKFQKIDNEYKMVNGGACITTKNSNEFFESFKGSSNSNYRLAISQEIQWLKACIKANMFIPLNQIKININQQFKTYI